MRDQEIIGLWEAYQQVHTQEEVEQVDDAPEKVEEETDLFDYLLEYLVAEGYADTNEAALAIMANMSEEWKQSIVEDNSTGATKTVGGQTFRDYNSDGLSDRQKRMKEFSEKRLRDSLKGV